MEVEEALEMAEQTKVINSKGPEALSMAFPGSPRTPTNSTPGATFGTQRTLDEINSTAGNGTQQSHIFRLTRGS